MNTKDTKKNTLPLILHLDRQANIVSLSEGLRQFLGISSDQEEQKLLGRSLGELCQAVSGDSLLRAVTSMPAHEKVRVLDFVLKSTNKSDSKNSGNGNGNGKINGLMYVVPSYENDEFIGYIVNLAPVDGGIVSDSKRFKKSRRINSWEQLLSIKNGIVMGVFFVAFLMILGGVVGISGLTLSSKNMETFVHQNMNPARVVGRINFLMADNRAQMALAMHHDPANPESERVDHKLEKHIETTVSNRQEIFDLWETYQTDGMTVEQKNISDIYWRARLQYVEEGLNPMMALLEAGDFAQAQKHLLHNVNPLYQYANIQSEKLISYLTTTAEHNYLVAVKRNQDISILAVSGIMLGLITIGICGFFFIQGSIKPLNASIQSLEHIARGDLSQSPEWFAYGEPGRVSASVLAMQVNLQSMIDDINASSETIQKQCKQMNSIVMSLAERFEEQHDRTYQVLEIAQNSSKQMRSLAMQVQKNTEAKQNGADSHFDLSEMRNIASSLSLEVFSAEEASMQMQQIADLIVDNRQEVQLAWAASEQLRATTHELDRLVGKFNKQS